MTRAYFTFLLALIGPVILFTQNVNFYASLDAKEVVTGSYFEVSFTVENGEPQNFIPPSFQGLQVASGPSQQSQISIVNGARSQKISYAYTLVATKPGTYTIGSASAIIKGKRYNTKSQKINVVKAASNSGAEEYFVTVELSDSTAYKGQQLTLKYKVFGVKDVQSAEFVNEPQFDGFFVSQVRNFRDRPQRVVINGVQYIEKTLKTYALFPQQSGSFEIPSIAIVLGIPSRDRRSNFFFSTRSIRKNVVAEGAKIKVLSTIGNPPISFSGGVGRFSIETMVDKRTITTDDAITLRMQVAGTGDSKFILAPQQPISTDWEIYDPNLLNEEVQERGDEMIAVKNFEYLMVPKKKGRILISPEFSYFDPDSARYVTLRGKREVINVVQGAGDNTLAGIAQEEALAFAPIATATTLRPLGESFLFSVFYWLLMGLGLMALVGVFIYKKRLVHASNIDPSIKQISEADKVAKARLHAASEHLERKEVKQFYTVVNDSLYGYVADKMQIPSSQLNRTNIKENLERKNVSEESSASFVLLLDRVQRALYAGGSAEEMQDIYNEAITTISNLESFLKKA